MEGDQPATTEAAMSDINTYLDKCLAECPEGAEELLLGELAKRVLQKYRPLERIEVRDRDGLVGYLMPAFIDVEDLPPDQRELVLLENDPNEPRMTEDEFKVWLDDLVEKRRSELPEQTARERPSS